MSKSLHAIKGKDAIKAFVRAGGIQKHGKGDHINIKMANESVPQKGKRHSERMRHDAIGSNESRNIERVITNSSYKKI